MLFSSIGTVGYMAPESIIANKYSVASDIFALGTLIFNVACLGSPFGHKAYPDNYILSLTADNLIHRYHSEALLRHWHCPEELIPLMHDCWNYRPEQRPTAERLLQTFDALIRHETQLTKTNRFS